MRFISPLKLACYARKTTFRENSHAEFKGCENHGSFLQLWPSVCPQLGCLQSLGGTQSSCHCPAEYPGWKGISFSLLSCLPASPFSHPVKFFISLLFLWNMASPLLLWLCRFGGRKGKGEMMLEYYNLKKKIKELICKKKNMLLWWIFLTHGKILKRAFLNLSFLWMSCHEFTYTSALAVLIPQVCIYLFLFHYLSILWLAIRYFFESLLYKSALFLLVWFSHWVI